MVKLYYFIALFCTFYWVHVAGIGCKDLKDFVNENNETYATVYRYRPCSNNENGEIESITIFGNITQEVVDTLASIKSIKSLTFKDQEVMSEKLNLKAIHAPEFIFYDLKYNPHVNRFNDRYPPKKVTKTLKNVKRIVYSGFKIPQYILDELSTLSNVKEIAFDNCSFDDNLDFSVLKKAKKLTNLALSVYKYEPKLTEMPESICKITNLKTLNLSESGISSIPKCIKKLTKLQTLELNDNQLTTLPKDLSKLTSLKYLEMGNNPLTTVPSVVKKLPKLESLVLFKNQFSSFPEVICEIKTLKSLSVFNSQLTDLPSCLTKLTKLKELDVSLNNFETVPSVISKLKLDTLKI